MEQAQDSNDLHVEDVPAQGEKLPEDEQRKKLLRSYSVISIVMVPILVSLMFSIGFKAGVFIMAIAIIAVIIAINVAFYFQAKRQNIQIYGKDAIKIYSISLIVGGALFLLGSILSLFYITLDDGTPTPGIEGLATLPFWIGVSAMVFILFMLVVAITTFAVMRKTTRR